MLFCCFLPYVTVNAWVGVNALILDLPPAMDKHEAGGMCGDGGHVVCQADCAIALLACPPCHWLPQPAHCACERCVSKLHSTDKHGKVGSCIPLLVQCMPAHV